MDVEIRRVSPLELKPLYGLQKEKVDFHVTPNTTYLGAFVDNKIVRCVAFAIIGSTLRYKTDGVLKEYRGNGIYSRLYDARELICKGIIKKRTTAFCTDKSIGMYLSRGFVKQSTLKNGVSFVTR